MTDRASSTLKKRADMAGWARNSASQSLARETLTSIVDRCFEQIRRVSPVVGHTGARGLVLLVTAAFLVNCAVMKRGLAQITALQQPQFTLMDENDVDLLSANVYLHETDASIGSKDIPLAHTMYSGPDGAWTLPYPNITTGQALFGNAYAPMDEYTPGNIIWPNGESPAACPPASAGLPVITVQLGHSSEGFQAGTGCQTFTATEPTGDTLVLNSYPNGTFTYTKRDGTQVIYSGWSSAQFPPDYTVQEIIYPDGRVLTYWYASDIPFLKSITRSDGLQLKYTYGQMSNGEWELTGVTAINNAYEYCNPSADTCALQMTWPTATYSYSGGTASSGGLTMTVTDAAGWTTTYTMDAYGRTTGVSSASINLTYAYCGSACTSYNGLPVLARVQNYVQAVSRAGQNWIYSGNPGSVSKGTCSTATYGFTNPVGTGKSLQQQICEDAEGVGIDDTFAPIDSDPFIQLTDEDGDIFYGPGALISKETMPEGNVNEYSWNVADLSAVTRVPKPGSPLTSSTSSANYSWSGCNALTCNQPNWVKDALGNETDYSYDAANGKVLTETRPADSNGIRPQTNYTYVQQSAYVLTATPNQYAASPPIWLLATESYCLTSAATTDSSTGQVDCAAGASDKVLKTYYYGPNSGPNNLFLRGVEIQANVQTHVTCYGYDAFGHQVSVTTPNAGLSLSSCDQFTQN